MQICGGQKKDAEVFRSSSNIVEIILSHPEEENTPSFLLKYQGKLFKTVTRPPRLFLRRACVCVCAYVCVIFTRQVELTMILYDLPIMLRDRVASVG